MKMLIQAAMAAGLALLATGCAGAGPLGEPARGVDGLKAAAAQSESAKTATPAAPRGGGSAIAPTGPDGAPTAGPTDAIGPH